MDLKVLCSDTFHRTQRSIR